MRQFEQDYYEASSFWEGESLQDEVNLDRYAQTEALIPADVNSVVDVGCGNGVFVNQLKKHKPALQICGVDRSEKALEFVQVDKIKADITSLPFKSQSFDCVCCLEVLEHLNVHDYPKALKALAATAKKYIIVSVPFAENVEESYTRCPSCKSIFNRELHLQSFDEGKFVNMFEGLGFKNISVNKLNPTFKFKWHHQYRKLFYPEQFFKWQSPICPICGYANEGNDPIPNASLVAKQPRKLVSYISAIPKLLWPKEKSYYWIIGLFERKA